MLTEDQIKDNQQQIIVALNNIDRPTHLLQKFMLEESDYFTAPASTNFHLNYPGGLAQHSRNVFACLTELNLKYGTDTNKDFKNPEKIDGRYGLYPDSSIVITALCHDLCKANFYRIDDSEPTDKQRSFLVSLCQRKQLAVPVRMTKGYASACIDYLANLPPGEKPEMPGFRDTYTVDDQLPLGHGEKSLYLLAQRFEVRPDEAMAIRWHMSAFEPGTLLGNSYNKAVERCKLVAMLFLADYEASQMMEA